MTHIPQEITDHFKEDKEVQNKIFSLLDEIKSNHLYHIERDIAIIQTDLAWLKKNPQDSSQNISIDWLSWFMRASISAMIAIITALILKG